jgi:hypothetical protein
MEIQEIEIAIDKKGIVKVHVRGVKGKKCLELTQELENALGQVIHRELTGEALDNEPGEQIDRQIEVKS